MVPVPYVFQIETVSVFAVFGQLSAIPSEFGGDVSRATRPRIKAFYVSAAFKFRVMISSVRRFAR